MTEQDRDKREENVICKMQLEKIVNAGLSERS